MNTVRKLISFVQRSNIAYNQLQIISLANKILLMSTDSKQASSQTPEQTEKKQRMRTIRIFRWEPGRKPCLQNYEVDINICGPMLLNVLIYIKARKDPTLTFRSSCREGKCGICALNVNGINTLSCICPLDGNPITVYPLPNMYVIRDLVTDMDHFYNQYRSIQPWMQRKNEASEGRGFHQYLQSEHDFNKLDGLYQCHMCACCQTACPSYWYAPNKYLGPAILLQAYRWIIDSRDEASEERMNALRGPDKLFRCRTILNCNLSCPLNLNAGLAISKLKLLLSNWSKKEKPKIDTLGLNKT